MKNKKNLQTLILRTLINNSKNENSFMTVSEIAEAVYGRGYIPRTARVLDNTIRNRMYLTKELAETNGHTLLPLRKQTNGDKNLRSRILGYKIAVNQFDENHINDELIYRRRIVESHLGSTMRFIDKAVENKLMAFEKRKEISEHIKTII